LILTYHRFGESRPDMTPPRVFARQLSYLRKHYRIVSLSRLCNSLSIQEHLTPGLAAITIDDGYRDAYEIAFPLLREFNLPATLFVVTDFVDHRGWLWTDKIRFLASRASKVAVDKAAVECGVPVDKSDATATTTKFNEFLKSLSDQAKDETISRIAARLGVELPAVPSPEFGAITWDQAREMDSAQLELGSHTATHPILTRVDDRRLSEELNNSRTRLEENLNRKIDLFCYPNGDYDQRVLRAAKQAGYSCAVTIESGLNESGCDPMQLRRVHTASDHSRFLQNTSGFDQLKTRLIHPESIRAKETMFRTAAQS
jgi:peptidoglycan/xylan/chitin deacetylase (PgdA/CDA1 family)